MDLTVCATARVSGLADGKLSRLFRKYGNVFSAQVAQAGGLRFGRLSAGPALPCEVRPSRL